jgi:predicted transcriptional regulator
MVRRNSFEVIEDILKILKNKELSVKAISEKIGAQWETTMKSLEFMKRINLVKERAGKKTNKVERLFSLK